MQERLSRRETLSEIFHKTSADEVLALFADVRECRMIEMIVALHDVLDDFGLAATRERYLARQHNVQDDAHGPHVNLLIVALNENFRCNVVRRAAHGIHEVHAREVLREAKINHLNLRQIILLEEHEVFGFNISV